MNFARLVMFTVTFFVSSSHVFAKMTSPERTAFPQKSAYQHLLASPYSEIRWELGDWVTNPKVLEIWDRKHRLLYYEQQNPTFSDVLLSSPLSEDAVETAGTSLLCVLTFVAYLTNAGGPAIDMNGRPATNNWDRTWVTQPTSGSSPPPGGSDDCKTSKAIQRFIPAPQESLAEAGHIKEIRSLR